MIMISTVWQNFRIKNSLNYGCNMGLLLQQQSRIYYTLDTILHNKLYMMQKTNKDLYRVFYTLPLKAFNQTYLSDLPSKLSLILTTIDLCRCINRNTTSYHLQVRLQPTFQQHLFSSKSMCLSCNKISTHWDFGMLQTVNFNVITIIKVTFDSVDDGTVCICLLKPHFIE